MAALAVITTQNADTVQAAPVGAAQNQLVAQQSCGAGGTVNVRLSWTASGWGNQYADISTSPTFATWTNAGPINGTVGTVDWTQLSSNTLYYSRIATWGGIEFIPSDTYVFNTISCAATPGSAPTSFSSVPSNLHDVTLSANAVRLSWTPGVNNSWYCVDIAWTEPELIAMYGSW